MNMIYRLMGAAGVVLLLAGTAAAQTTSKAIESGTAQFTVAQVSGEVVMVDGNYLLVKIRPSGVQRWFSVGPDRQFIIDGQPEDHQPTDARNGSHRDRRHKNAACHRPDDHYHQRHGTERLRPQLERPARERRTPELHGSRFIPVQRRRQIGVGLPAAEGYERHRHQDRQRTRVGDFDADSGYGQGAEVASDTGWTERFAHFGAAACEHAESSGRFGIGSAAWFGSLCNQEPARPLRPDGCTVSRAPCKSHLQ